MTEKNAFLKFVHKNIEDFTPQQMELATRILKGDKVELTDKKPVLMSLHSGLVPNSTTITTNANKTITFSGLDFKFTEAS
jgi:hypothetical protein